MDDALLTASGKWPSILLSLGLPETFISGKHGPCPKCDGKDRFRWIDSAGSGRWICNQCGTGDGMDLACEYLKQPFREVIMLVKPLVGGANFAVVPPKPNQAQIKKRSRDLMNVWRSGRYPEMVADYLKGRGLPQRAINGADLRGAKIRHYDADGNCTGVEPAMLARVITSGRKTACLHRTYIDKGEKKLTPSTRPWTGGAIRLFSEDSETLAVAEGIETSLAARYMYYRSHKVWIPAWSLINAQMMMKFSIPKTVKKLLIFADNDASYTGHAAAYELARRAVVQSKIKAEVFTPSKVGNDWLDELNSMKRTTT